ncbi:hypothetical protein HH310_22945 [Actinoplanes sp. TBRC 11911]|uniref:hypothetical protein n=1 Tax=Actinoplanes sp. TBRC 11911 TaxID=2729386 RepID=UPI00145F249A|nr:hypothetical protein [Actinoplanes sp. TBRC 11911]NMO54027.1 hypothetical protein [Actinoplanes sp. TBRC 11911]
MPATWSRYDDQPLPNPKDGQGGDPPPAHAPAPNLKMNWWNPHVPTPPPAHGSGGSGSTGGGSGGGNGGSGGSGAGGGSAGGNKGTDPATADPDSNYWNPQAVPVLPGMPNLPTSHDYDHVEVNTEAMAAYEQNILTTAMSLVGTYTYLRNQSQTIFDQPIWGRGEGNWSKPSAKAVEDGADPTSNFIPTDSAVEAEKFAEAMAPAQQGALQGAADMLVLSGLFIEMLDATITSYAQMDMMTIFPDPKELQAEGAFDDTGIGAALKGIEDQWAGKGGS